MSSSKLLYRFMDSAAALKSIEGRQFRVGRILEFNDPFEWRPGIIGINEGYEEMGEYLINASVEGLNSKIGILCMSDTIEEPVLWSHYADRHYGVAFELDYLMDDSIHKIYYDKPRPVIDVSKIHDDEHLKTAIDKMIDQKSNGWGYEREYRVHVDLAGCSISGGHYFKSIPDDLLVRVVLGFRCHLEESYVAKALHEAGLVNCKVSRAKMDQNTYKVIS